MGDSLEVKQEEETKFDTMPINSKPLRSDVVGRSGEFIDDFILAMDSEKVYKRMGVSPDKTFLITGAPGTGKTLGVNALLNEVNREVMEYWKMAVNVKPTMIGMSYDIGKYGSKYVNQGSVIAQSFFDCCFNLAKKTNVLIEFDEAEVLFGNRADGGTHKEDNKVLNTIMKNLQIVHDTPNMYMVLMSNHPEAFDEASIRAGRIDKKYELGLPGELERKLAYDHTVDKINKAADYSVIRSYDNLELAKMTDGYSYADIVESVNSAVKKRATEIARERTSGAITSGYISQKRLIDSIGSHSESFHKEGNGIGFL